MSEPRPNLGFLVGYSLEQQLADRDRENLALREDLRNAFLLIYALIAEFGGDVAVSHHRLTDARTCGIEREDTADYVRLRIKAKSGGW